jgi:guanylate kinase
MPGELFVISAPSGAGKSTVINALRERLGGLGYSVSHTTRRARANEKDAVDYHFVDEQTFMRMIREGAFVEWAQVYEAFYGTSYLDLQRQVEMGLDVLLDLDSQGARNIKARFNTSTLIYLLPPSLETLEKRLRDRASDPEPAIEMRMQKTVEEIRNCSWYDFLVVNEDLETAVGEVKSIVIAQRCRTPRRLPEVGKRFDLSFP